MPRLLFVNLPVADLGRSMAFFNSLGFSFDPDLTDASSACLVIGEGASVVLMQREYFATFHHRATTAPGGTVEVTVSVVVDARREVDFICQSAFEAGATRSMDPTDQGFVYTWSFTDLDGHVWEILSLQER